MSEYQPINISAWSLASSHLAEECFINETHRVAVPVLAPQDERDKELLLQLKAYLSTQNERLRKTGF